VGAIIAAAIGGWAIGTWIRNAIGGDKIDEILFPIFDKIVAFFTETIPEFFVTVGETVVDEWNAIAGFFTETIPSFFATLWDTIKTIFSDAVEAIKTTLSDAWDSITTTVTDAFNGIATFFSNTWNEIKTTITDTVTSIKTTLSEKWTSIKNDIVGTVTALKADISLTFSNIWSSITETVGNIATSIKEGFQEAIDFITALPEQALAWGSDFINGLIDGIKSGIDDLVDTVSGIADSVAEYLHFSVPDKGALTDYESWMPDFIGGLAKGIESSRSILQAAVKNVASDLVIFPELSGITAAKSSESTLQTVIAEGSSNAESITLMKDIRTLLTAINNKSTTLTLDGKTVGTTVSPYVDSAMGQAYVYNQRGIAT